MILLFHASSKFNLNLKIYTYNKIVPELLAAIYLCNKT